jgi:hypothetical protein
MSETMDCEDSRQGELLERYLRNGLEPEAQDQLETHLLECGACARELEMRLIARNELLAKEEAIRSAPVRAFTLWRWQSLALASVLLAVVGSAIIMQMPRSANPPGREVIIAQAAVKNSSPAGPPDQGTAGQLPGPKTGLSNAMMKGPGKADAKAGASIPDTSPVSQISNTSNSQEKPLEQAPEPGAELATKVSPVDIENLTQQAHVSSRAYTPVTENGLTPEQETELANLGQVQAAPFTFTGVSTKRFTTDYPGVTHDPKNSTSALGVERTSFREAMTKYLEERYGVAGELLEQAANAEPDAMDIQFYLGVCRLLSGQTQESIEPLKRATTAKSVALRQQAHYYLAKAYIQTRNLHGAETELLAASQMPGTLKDESAVSLAKVRRLQQAITQ